MRYDHVDKKYVTVEITELRCSARYFLIDYEYHIIGRKSVDTLS